MPELIPLTVQNIETLPADSEKLPGNMAYIFKRAVWTVIFQSMAFTRQDVLHLKFSEKQMV